VFFVVRAVSQDVAARLGHHRATRALRREVGQKTLVEFAGEAVSKNGLDNPCVNVTGPPIFLVELCQLQGGRCREGY